MNIKRFIDKNQKLIMNIAIMVVFILLGIKLLNSFYEEQEEKRQQETAINGNSNQYENPSRITYSTESNSIQETMESFVNYCNKKEVEKAYQILTPECKNAIFATVEDFKTRYVNNIYNIPRNYKMVKWSTEDNRETYLVTLYADILATGGNSDFIQEYYTFVETDKGTYQININNYIYGEERNLSTTSNGITVLVKSVDVFEEYEKATIIITNNTSKKICLTGNTYKEKIYLQNSKDVEYSSLNSVFDTQEIIIEGNSSQTFVVHFNKTYNLKNKAEYVVLSDVILDYEQYLNSEEKSSYTNRITIKARYDK